MRWPAAMALLLLVAAAAQAKAAPATPTSPPVAYTLSPVITAGALTALSVEIRFAEGPSGRTRLAWGAHWAGDNRLWANARDVRIEGGEATPDGPGAWIVRAPPGTPIIATYRIVSAYDHDPTDDDTHHAWPVIRPTWFYAVGEALFAKPEDQAEAPATFAWTGAPKGFGFASDLQHLAGPGRAALLPGTVADMEESILIGGPAMRLATRKIDGAPVRIAAVGRYRFGDRDFEDQVLSILKIERAFWGERATPYLVTLSPTASVPTGYSYSGVGRGDAFALWVDPITPVTDLRYLLTHEYFHTWNPLLVGRLPNDETEPAGFWFSEGFTDYYARKLMLGSGQLAAADFAGLWNDMLRAYAISPVRTAPNSRIASEFRRTPELQKLPYQRGALLAAVLDRDAQARGTSLDAVMRRMRTMAASPGEARHADQLFPVAYEATTGIDPRPLIARHVIDGEPIALPADAFGRCFQVTTGEVPIFDRGWDATATAAADQVVSGLRPDSPAYAAGLRDGMKIVELLAGRPGDGSQPYLMKVKPPDGPEQVISFRPAGEARITRQVVTPTPGPGCSA